MIEYEEILKRAEKASEAVSDPELRKVAFEQLLKREFERADGAGPSPDRSQPSIRQPPRIKTTSAPQQGRQEPLIRETVRVLEIGPDEPELPAWDAISNLEKYCWILQAAHRKGCDGLMSSEISFLISEIFRESHGTNQVNNLKTKIRAGFVQSVKVQDGPNTMRLWRILRRGTQHLESLMSREQK